MSSADVSAHSGPRLQEAAALTPFTTAREVGAAGAAGRAFRSGRGGCGPVPGSGELRAGGSRRKGPLSGAGGRGGAAAAWAPRGAVRRGSGCLWRRGRRRPRRARGCAAGGSHQGRASRCWRRQLCRPAAPRRASLLTSCARGRGAAPGVVPARRERVPSPTSAETGRPPCPLQGPPPAPPSRGHPRTQNPSVADAGGSRRCWEGRASARRHVRPRGRPFCSARGGRRRRLVA